MNTQIIAIANQKGGVGKTTTCANLGIGLAQEGKKVLLIDGDPQGSLSISLGYSRPDTLPITLSDMMGKVLTDTPIQSGEGILHHAEGVDLMPADIQLSGMEVSLVNAMSRETILRQYLDTVKRDYTHIIIDCQPSLGMLTVNALAAANRVLIPVQAEYLPAKGLEQLLQTISKVRRQINPKLQIDGILLTMVDGRTNFAQEISALLRETYGSKIKVFGSEIPHSVRAKEISADGKSIYAHDPEGKVAAAYKNLTKEVLKIEKQREKHIQALEEELTTITGMLRMCITENAANTMTEETYRNTHAELCSRFEETEAKLAALQKQRDKMKADAITIGGMMFELGELDTLPVVFDEKLWHGTIDHVTVHADERVVFHFKDGKKIVTRL